MGTAGSARPAQAQSESSEEPDLELGKRFTVHVCYRRYVLQLHYMLIGTTRLTPLTGDLTEQEQEAFLDDARTRAVVSQLLHRSGSADDQLDEESSDDEDYDEEDVDDEDEEDDDDEDDDDEDERDIRRRTFAFFGFGEPTVRKQLAKHPRLSECQPEQLLHSAAQLLNLSSAAVNGKDCLSIVSLLDHTGAIRPKAAPFCFAAGYTLYSGLGVSCLQCACAFTAAKSNYGLTWSVIGRH